MPGMLGWFKMTSETGIEDIEWLLARAAGFDAGFAFVTGFKVLKENAISDKILQKIADWEKLRLAGLFTDEQKILMRDTKNEFSLIKSNDNEWGLTRVYSAKFIHNKKTRQPGEPLYSTFKFTNHGQEQTLGFILTASNCNVSDIVFEFNNYKEIKIPLTLLCGQTLKYTGGNTALVCDKNWKTIKQININPSDFKVQQGEQTLTLDCKFANTGEDPCVKLEIRTKGKTERITMK
jgi:hypothetical protein